MKKWIAFACLGVVVAYGAIARPTASTTTDTSESRVDRLRRLSSNARNGLSPSEANDLAMALAGSNLGVTMLPPKAVSDTAIRSLGEHIAKRQLEWQSAPNLGITASSLGDALNAQLGLLDGPTYLAVRRDEIDRVRFAVWVQLPEISTGVPRREGMSKEQLFPDSMSPVEAFLTADTLLYQKLSNDDFLRSPEELVTIGTRVNVVKPGLHAVPNNPRKEEFRNRLIDTASRKWSTPEDAVRDLSTIF